MKPVIVTASQWPRHPKRLATALIKRISIKKKKKMKKHEKEINELETALEKQERRLSNLQSSAIPTCQLLLCVPMCDIHCSM